MEILKNKGVYHRFEAYELDEFIREGKSYSCCFSVAYGLYGEDGNYRKQLIFEVPTEYPVDIDSVFDMGSLKPWKKLARMLQAIDADCKDGPGARLRISYGCSSVQVNGRYVNTKPQFTCEAEWYPCKSENPVTAYPHKVTYDGNGEDAAITMVRLMYLAWNPGSDSARRIKCDLTGKEFIPSSDWADLLPKDAMLLW